MMQEAVLKACDVLRQGGVILYPTDTIWGLGCDATRSDAVEKIFRIKKRSEAKSLITLMSDLRMLEKYFPELPEMAEPLYEQAVEPLTIILPAAVGLAANVIAEDGSAGVRIPDHDFCQRLMAAFKKPIVSTSANLSERPAPRSFVEIDAAILDAVDYIVPSDLDSSQGTKASSIIKLELDGRIAIIRP